MDMIREEYEQDMFVFRETGHITRVRWYRAHPGAQMVRPYTIFGSGARSELKVVPLGERWNLNFYQRGSWGNFGGYLGQNICGPDGWWYKGASISDPIPPCECIREMIIPIKEVPAGDQDGMNRNFTLAQMPMSNNSVTIYVNGVAQEEGQDYSLTGQAIRFTNGAQPKADSTFWAQYWVFT